MALRAAKVITTKLNLRAVTGTATATAICLRALGSYSYAGERSTTRLFSLPALAGLKYPSYIISASIHSSTCSSTCTENHVHNYQQPSPPSTTKSPSSSTVSRECWNCHIPESNPASFSCHSCSVLLEKIGPGDYFQLFALPRTFNIERKLLDRKYIQLQRQLHPDNFGKKSLKEQKISVEHSAMLNEAYHTLKDPTKRVLYLLSLEGIPVGEHAKAVTDVDLLQDIMEIKEAIEEADGNIDKLKKIYHENEEKMKKIHSEINLAFSSGNIRRMHQLATELQYLAKIEDDVRIMLPIV